MGKLTRDCPSSLADTYQVLYLDAAKHLPAEMQAHLPKEARDLLSPHVSHLKLRRTNGGRERSEN